MTALHHGNVLQFHSWYVLTAAKILVCADLVCASYLSSQVATHDEVHSLGLGASSELRMRAGARPEITSGWFWSIVWAAIS